MLQRSAGFGPRLWAALSALQASTVDDRPVYPTLRVQTTYALHYITSHTGVKELQNVDQTNQNNVFKIHSFWIIIMLQIYICGYLRWSQTSEAASSVNLHSCFGVQSGSCEVSVYQGCPFVRLRFPWRYFKWWSPHFIHVVPTKCTCS